MFFIKLNLKLLTKCTKPVCAIKGLKKRPDFIVSALAEQVIYISEYGSNSHQGIQLTSFHDK